MKPERSPNTQHFQCRDCGHRVNPLSYLAVCPACGGRLRPVGGIVNLEGCR